MSKPKIWTLPELLDRIWSLSRGKRTAVAVAKEGATIEIPRLLWGSDKIVVPPGVTIKRVVTGWDEDYKPRTYELNKISAASAAALYERIKHMRVEAEVKHAADIDHAFEAGRQRGQAEMVKAKLEATGHAESAYHQAPKEYWTGNGRKP